VYHKTFSEEDYKELDDAEKKLFDDLLTFSRTDKHEGLMLYKHRKYNDKERDEDIKKFNILRGEVLGGNDNPNLIKELKVLLFKLLNQKIISRGHYNKIMEQIFIL
jgi:hypothetical protein